MSLPCSKPLEAPLTWKANSVTWPPCHQLDWLLALCSVPRAFGFLCSLSCKGSAHSVPRFRMFPSPLFRQVNVYIFRSSGRVTSSWTSAIGSRPCSTGCHAACCIPGACPICGASFVWDYLITVSALPWTTSSFCKSRDCVPGACAMPGTH